MQIFLVNFIYFAKIGRHIGGITLIRGKRWLFKPMNCE